MRWGAAALVLLPRLKFDVPFWRLDDAERLPLMLMVATYALAAAGSSAWVLAGRSMRGASLVSFVLAVFGLAFLYMLVKRVDSSRAVMFYVFATSICLILLSFSLRGVPLLGIGVLALAVAALVALNLRPPANLQRRGLPETETALINTGFYNLHAVYYHEQFQNPAVSGGGLARVADDVLLVTGDGHLYVLAWNGAEDPVKVRALPYRVPVNGDEFAADLWGVVGRPVASTSGGISDTHLRCPPTAANGLKAGSRSFLKIRRPSCLVPRWRLRESPNRARADHRLSQECQESGAAVG